MDLFPKRHRKEPIELQLTAMIDIFSMIVIFLILGSVFGAADIVVPPNMQIPKSISKEGIESAPRVTISEGKVDFSMLPDSIPISDFRSPDMRARLRAKLKTPLDEYQRKRKSEKTAVAPLNLLADRRTPYAEVFDVVVVFRELGFNTILFVATGMAGAKP